MRCTEGDDGWAFATGMRIAGHAHLQVVQRFWQRTNTVLAVHNTSMKQKGRVLVYTGEGAGSRSVASTVESLRSTFIPAVEVLPCQDHLAESAHLGKKFCCK